MRQRCVAGAEIVESYSYAFPAQSLKGAFDVVCKLPKKNRFGYLELQ